MGSSETAHWRAVMGEKDGCFQMGISQWAQPIQCKVTSYAQVRKRKTKNELEKIEGGSQGQYSALRGGWTWAQLRNSVTTLRGLLSHVFRSQLSLLWKKTWKVADYNFVLCVTHGREDWITHGREALITHGREDWMRVE
jgi:hypothetical protein